MSQNTVAENQGDVPLELTSRAVPHELPTTIDPLRSLAETWCRQSAVDWSVPVRRPFDAQYWACWLVAVVFPLLIAYLLLTR